MSFIEGTVFKLNDVYIPQKELEKMYFTGIITGKDSVQIFENSDKNGVFYRISDLCKLYGDRYPFRMIARAPPKVYQNPQVAKYIPKESQPSEYRNRMKPRNYPPEFEDFYSRVIRRQLDFEDLDNLYPCFPLFYSNIYDEPMELTPENISLLSEIFSKIKPGWLTNEAAFLTRFFQRNDHPNYCDTCQCFVTKSNYKCARHVISAKHLTSLHSVSPWEFNFWVFALRASMPKRRIYFTNTINFISPSKTEAFQKPENIPRVPLLDVPRYQNFLISKRQYKRKHEWFCEKLRNSKFDKKRQMDTVKFTCYHCPGEPKMTTWWEVIQHVFDGIHCQNISYLAYPSDFHHYEAMIDYMEVKSGGKKKNRGKYNKNILSESRFVESED